MHILRNGKGSFETCDNTRIQFGYGDFEEDKLGADKGLSMKDSKALGLSTGMEDASAVENEAAKAGDENEAKDQVTAICNELRIINQRMKSCILCMDC